MLIPFKIIGAGKGSLALRGDFATCLWVPLPASLMTHTDIMLMSFFKGHWYFPFGKEKLKELSFFSQVTTSHGQWSWSLKQISSCACYWLVEVSFDGTFLTKYFLLLHHNINSVVWDQVDNWPHLSTTEEVVWREYQSPTFQACSQGE